jgi:hypothetical protein
MPNAGVLGRLICAAVGTLALAPQPIAAQGYTLSAVHQSLEDFAKEEGVLDRVGAVMDRELRPGAKAEFVFTIDPAKSYRVLGVCDLNCDDLEIAVSDSATGEILHEDEERDSFPVIDIDPGAARRIDISVTMADCSDSECIFAAGLYRVD